MSERSQRQPWLQRDPEIEAVSMKDLVGVAHAVEAQAVRRYAQLIEHMEQRGEHATAAAFQVLLEQAREHQQAVQRWAEQLGEPIPPVETYTPRLPPGLSSAWDETIDSALLTPYRAFALAVDNRERGFAFYSYLAARTDDPRVRDEAEKLGMDQLHRAAALRRFRRRAWHAERRPLRLPDLTVGSHRALEEVLAQHEADIARQHRALAVSLRAAGDLESAALLEQLLPPAPAAAPQALDAAKDPADDHVARGRESIAEGGEDARALLAAWADTGSATANAASAPAHLLVQAQKPLEAFGETLEAIMRTTEGALFEQAAPAMSQVVDRLARLSLQVARRLQAPAPPVSS